MKLVKTGEKDDKIILKNEDGLTALFTFLDLLLYEGSEYAVIADENDDAYIMAFAEGKNGRETYTDITDDDLYDTLVEMFESEEE